HIGDLDVSLIEVREEVREACSGNKCQAFETNWSCPPGCGTLEECKERMEEYKKGIILQTSGELEDQFDVEGMMELNKQHDENIAKFATKLGDIHPDAMVLGAGCCTICKTCTYPDQPCRFPEKMISSMEA